MDNQDFADDLALIVHTQKQIRKKASTVAKTSSRLVQDLHQEKGKVFKINTANSISIMLTEQPLKEVKSFTYLDITVDIQRGTDADVKIRIGKVRVVFCS